MAWWRQSSVDSAAWLGGGAADERGGCGGGAKRAPRDCFYGGRVRDRIGIRVGYAEVPNHYSQVVGAEYIRIYSKFRYKMKSAIKCLGQYRSMLV
uniref:Uncharacterized protein n=1 Tax=Oryza brachyantha TaxID=4533 RepID=J3M570_ORYBR